MNKTLVVGCIFLLGALSVSGCGNEKCSGGEASDIQIMFDVTVVFKDGSGAPAAVMPVEVDCFKVPCDGGSKRVEIFPFTGNTDTNGRVEPTLFGHDFNNQEDRITFYASFKGAALSGETSRSVGYTELSSFDGSTMPITLEVVGQ